MTDDRGPGDDDRPLRLFVAVEIPEEAKRAIGAAIQPWREAFPRARWVPPENWHVTLKFLGPTQPRLVPWVLDTVRSVATAHGPAPVRIDGLGAFPSTGRARVVWAGVDDGSGTLSRLAAGLEAALAEEFRSEIRPFTPHVTVATSEPPIGLPDRYGATSLRTEAFSADRVVLFRSHLGRRAARYESIGEAPLGG